MANLVYACWRGGDLEGLPGQIEQVARRITPASLGDPRPRVVVGHRECLGLTAPNRSVAVAGCCARLGLFTGPAQDWHRPGTPEPEGSYALVRSGPGTVEAWSDEAGTRTLWYVFDAQRLLVSTSLRALICLLGDLDWNPAAFAWYLSSGTLGPIDAWDRRIRRLPRGAHLVLDRGRWTLDLHTRPVRFTPQPMGEAEASESLRNAFESTLHGPDVLPSGWILPLSGGYDSRLLLAALARQGIRPHTVTWGMAASRAQRGNDAWVAEQLARYYGLRNDYLVTETLEASPREVVDTFLEAHGGTTDTLFPYLDGLRLWSRLAGDGVDGILRGDEGFGTRSRPERHHRHAMSLTLLKDFLPPEDAEAIADGRQHLPEEARRQRGESLQGYGDRLLHSFELPINLAALNDVKSPFLEIASPMLSRSVLALVRRMPDHLRALRATYERLVRSLSPPIPFATLAADDSRNGFLREPRFRDWIAGELEGDFCARVLPEGVRLTWLAATRRSSLSLLQSRSARATLKRLVPGSWVRILKRALPPEPPSAHDLALRCAMASRLERLLRADAGHLARCREGQPGLLELA
jgi:hypothetical protein